MWKLASVSPIFKKGDKQIIKNYRPISLLPICGKILEKSICNNLSNHLITFADNAKSIGFSSGGFHYKPVINEIHQAFGSEFLEVRSVFLDISFGKVWQDGLTFKLIGVSDHLSK